MRIDFKPQLLESVEEFLSELDNSIRTAFKEVALSFEKAAMGAIDWEANGKSIGSNLSKVQMEMVDIAVRDMYGLDASVKSSSEEGKGRVWGK